MVRRYYGIDPMAQTLGGFLGYLKQIPKLKLWESGKDPHEKDNPKNLTVEEFVEKVKSGDLTPDALKPGTVRKLSDAQRKAEESRLIEQLGLDINKVKEFAIPPMAYGQRE